MKKQRHRYNISSLEKKRDYLTGKIEVSFLDVYEIDLKDISKPGVFFVEFNKNRVQIGESLTIGVNSTSQNLAFTILDERESPSPPRMGSSLKGRSLSFNLRQQYEKNIQVQQKSPQIDPKLRIRGTFELNVQSMFQATKDSKSKVFKKKQILDSQLPIYQQVSESDKPFAKKTIEMIGFVETHSVLNINHNEEIKTFEKTEFTDS